MISLFLGLTNCSNNPEFETSEIKILKLLQGSLQSLGVEKQSIDVRKIVTRKRIDSLSVPLLFAELPSGQNGLLALYPEKGVGATWIGADGATLTLKKGVLIATRGMGDDIMGSSTFIPEWEEIQKTNSYTKSLSQLKEDNKLMERHFKCLIEKRKQSKIINIFDRKFETQIFVEKCEDSIGSITNTYYVDAHGVVRRSYQFHSEEIGYILTERVDQLNP